MYNQGSIDITGISNLKIVEKIQNEGFGSIKITNELKSEVKFQSLEDEKWYSLSEGNMSHKNQDTHGGNHKDAVTKWNDELKYTSSKSGEVREYMKNPDNYYVEHESYNKSDGAKLRQKYDDPVLSNDKIDDGKCK